MAARGDWTKRRSDELYAEQQQRVCVRTDRLFAGLILGQFLFGVLLALVVSPRTWAGHIPEVHVHVASAVVVGGCIAAFPVALALLRPGWWLTRHVIAAAQMLFSALLIHLTGGRIETHFHVFGSLAVIAFYRDWRVLATASAVVAADHLVRSLFFPYSVFGILAASPWRAVEHAAWIVFEDVFLFSSCQQGQREMKSIAETRARLEQSNRNLTENVIAPLQETVQRLTFAATELNLLTEKQRSTVGNQATALQQTQVTAEEINQTSLVASQKAQSILETARRAEEVGQAGESAIHQSLAGLTDIREQVTAIAERIAELNDRTRQISGITETVKDLADQSNMLALNAAIEAVRSGEHGKGFSVVAREIRNLADQSIQSTNRVREILEDISNAIKVTADITERGKARMDAGIVQMRTSGEKLQDLSSIVKEIAAAVRQIAAAVGQQDVGIKQIFDAVTEQTRMMNDTVNRLDSTNESAVAVNGIAQTVSSVLTRVRIEERGGEAARVFTSSSEAGAGVR